MTGLRNAKVHDLHVAIALHHDVGGLDVTVDDVVAMGDGERGAHLRTDLCNLARMDVAALLDGGLEIRAAHVLHDDVVRIAVTAPIVDVDDVGATQVGGSLCLLPEACGKVGI